MSAVQPPVPYAELAQQNASMRSYITDLLNTVHLLEQRDRNHLEAKAEWFQEKAELQDEVSILAAEITTLKTEKHDALTEQNKEWCEACKLHSEMQVKQQQVDAIKRGIKRLPYKKMGSSDKHVAIDYVEQAAARSWDIADLSLPFHPVMEQMAARLGLSEAQLTRINQTQKKAGAWTHDVKREFKERVGKKEIYTCTVTVSLDKILNDPESIEKPEGPKGSHQGGARVRRCKDCDSDDMDRYALEYCRSCKKAHLQLLPGLRSDANALDALDAIKQDRYTIQDHVFEYSQQDQNEQKHDAFTQDEVQELNAQLESTIHQIDTQLTMQTGSQPADMLPNKQKHDAFTQTQAEIPTEVEQKHHTFTSQHTQDAEQSPLIESNMQGKGTVEESLHDATVREGMRVDTPIGMGTIRSIRECPILHRLRCSVHTDIVQPNGSHFAAFNVCQVQPIGQGVLL